MSETVFKLNFCFELPDEDDLVLWTEAEEVASTAAELRNREDRRVSRPPPVAEETEDAEAEAPPGAAATPPEALPKLPGVRLLVLPQES